METLNRIQKELKAPKNQRNSFGNYNYRSCEDILEAVKPLLGTAVLTLSDDIIAENNRVYVRATATLKDGNQSVSVTAFAREPETKKGMDESQITGAASSYARKYALNGLFCIDDTKDADSTNDHGKAEQPKPAAKPQAKPMPTSQQWDAIIAKKRAGVLDIEQVKKYFTLTDQQIETLI